MKIFEYKTIIVELARLEETLNEYGKKGWRLFSVDNNGFHKLAKTTHGVSRVDAAQLIFEREK